MTASAPTSSLFQPWERQGSPWKQRPDQIALCARQTERLGEVSPLSGNNSVSTNKLTAIESNFGGSEDKPI